MSTALSVPVTGTIPFVKGRVAWECAHCGNVNNVRIGHGTWKAECSNCGESVAILNAHVPRGYAGKSRAHFVLWLQRRQRQLSQSR